eukprot:1493023-Rhodomonas_salina.4
MSASRPQPPQHCVLQSSGSTAKLGSGRRLGPRRMIRTERTVCTCHKSRDSTFVKLHHGRVTSRMCASRRRSRHVCA